MGTTHPLKAYRDRQTPRLTQEGLAALLKVKRTTVARWETGKRKIGGKELRKASEITKIPMRELRPDLAELMSEAAE